MLQRTLSSSSEFHPAFTMVFLDSVFLVGCFFVVVVCLGVCFLFVFDFVFFISWEGEDTTLNFATEGIRNLSRRPDFRSVFRCKVSQDQSGPTMA